jgi:hypothetical protein
MTTDETTPDDEVEVTTPEAKPPAPPRAKTGWCLTNDHRRCPVTFGRLTCMCDCPDHGVDFVPSHPNDQLSEQLKTVLRNHGKL